MPLCFPLICAIPLKLPYASLRVRVRADACACSRGRAVRDRVRVRVASSRLSFRSHLAASISIFFRPETRVVVGFLKLIEKSLRKKLAISEGFA